MKVKPSLGCRNLRPRTIAFARVLAIDDAVEVLQVGLLVAGAAAGPRELPGVGDGVADALGGGRMRRQEVRRARIDVGALRAQVRVRPHRGQEALGAVGVEAGARRDADADAVGLELLGAREVGERDLGLGERQRAELRIAEQIDGDAVDHRGLPRLVLADLGVARDDVRHLVRQHGGELGVVVGERDQPAGDVELAVRQREGVDRGRVQDGDLVLEVRPLGGCDQLVDGLLQHALQLGVLVGAAVGREDAKMLALLRRRWLDGGGGAAFGFRRQHRGVDAAKAGQVRTAADHEREQRDHDSGKARNSAGIGPIKDGLRPLHDLIVLHDFDLLGGARLDPRPAALFDRAPHSNMPACQLL